MFQIDWTGMTRKFIQKNKKLGEKLQPGEKVSVVDDRTKKKSAPGKFYKQIVQNISYFNRKDIYHNK